MGNAAGTTVRSSGETAGGPTPSRPGSASEYAFLLPAFLRDEPDRPRGPRSGRDWMIDVFCFTLSIGWAVLCMGDLLSPQPSMIPGWAGTAPWLIWTDMAVGIALSVALWWRRRWPVQIAIAGAVLGMFAISVAVAGLIALFTLAVHRGFTATAWLAGATMASTAVFGWLRPEKDTGFLESLLWSVIFVIVIQLWGMIVRARRQLVVSLRDRAQRAESEQRLRVSQARTLERTRIAREMHDVLAHRISLLSLHAGALEIHPGVADTAVAGAAGVIRASAHQALQDLREVITVLREPADESAPERPQPTLSELPMLAEESRAAGAKVKLTLHVEVEQALRMPVGTGRTAYRIVQEGLTNARKHAPGTTVQVAVGGSAGTGLTIDIRNPAPVGRPLLVIPGTGTGLIGLTERATLAGGTLSHGRDPYGEFVLEAWLPWPT
ncbi:histidine kinase [Actinoplanes sp. NPDC051494]|uniref:sensor histidine kinase n=1 Tax=Actinoplanes sp. NPDC051494 TaxID=3363907 RepID=UPI0037AB7C49